MRQLNEQDIEAFIKADQIVWAKPVSGTTPLLQGKFIRMTKGACQGQAQYSFCPYKKGHNLPFLPANQWLVDESQGASKEDLMKQILAKKTQKK